MPPPRLHEVPPGAQLDEPHTQWTDRKLAEEAFLAAVRSGQTAHNTYGLAAQAAQLAHDTEVAIAALAPRVKKIDTLETEVRDVKRAIGLTQQDIGSCLGGVSDVGKDVGVLSKRVGDVESSLASLGTRIDAHFVKLNARVDAVLLELDDERKARAAEDASVRAKADYAGRKAEEVEDITGERYVKSLERVREKFDSLSEEAVKRQLEFGSKKAEVVIADDTDAILAKAERRRLVFRVVLVTALTILGLVAPLFAWLLSR